MEPPVRDPTDVAENKDLAALSYVWVLSVVVLLSKRSSPFIRFHARQGALLFGLSLVAWAIPVVGKLLEVLLFLLSVMGFLHAAQGLWSEVPFIGPFSRGSLGDLRGSWKDVVHAVTNLWARVRSQASSEEVHTATAEVPPSPVSQQPSASDSASPPPAQP